MKSIHYCIGLPRSGSTLLMNILQQNPLIFSSSTCPTPYLLDSCKDTASSISEFIAMKQDVLNDCLINFFKHGNEGWFSSLTEKPIVISKNRAWDTSINFLFRTYENPKFILCLRDLRDIICSFEKLAIKFPVWNIGSKEDPVHTMSFDKRMEIYCTDTGANLGRPLHFLPHVFEWIQKRPNNFFLFRFEDFNRNPEKILKHIYNFLELPLYDHDLNNINQSDQYEHDTVYRTLVTHKTEKQFKKIEPSWPSMMSEDQSDSVIFNNKWYYQTFYPEIYNEFVFNRDKKSF